MFLLALLQRLMKLTGNVARKARGVFELLLHRMLWDTKPFPTTSSWPKNLSHAKKKMQQVYRSKTYKVNAHPMNIYKYNERALALPTSAPSRATDELAPPGTGIRRERAPSCSHVVREHGILSLTPSHSGLGEARLARIAGRELAAFCRFFFIRTTTLDVSWENSSISTGPVTKLRYAHFSKKHTNRIYVTGGFWTFGIIWRINVDQILPSSG